MDKALYADIREALKSRTSWEKKLSDFYRLRFTGIPRAKKPYAGAPDMHYPLVDSVIEKLKPFYAQQIYGDSVLATFIAKEGTVDRGQVASVERWFDYQLKQRSEIEKNLLKVTDYMLTYSFGAVKVYWDSAERKVAYAPIDPFYMIVPPWTEDDDPDWFVHVMTLSKQQYRANKNFNQNEDFIGRICGKGSTDSGGSSTDIRQQDSSRREGITYAANNNQIVIWECYSKEDGKWVVETISPCLGAQDEPIRKPFGLPYKHGELPICVFRFETGQSGWYSTRGIAEKLGDHEQALNKSWNSKLQFLDFFGHPVYKNSNLSPINTANFQAAPGRVLPPGVEPVMAVGAPPDFEQEMQFVRALAEDMISIPDLSSGQHLTARPDRKGNTTATQVNAVMALTNQNNDLRSRLFRLQLGRLYKQSWALLNQFASNQLSYIFEAESQNLDPQLLKSSYDIQPSGSADSWNKQARQAKALAYYQQFSQNPYVPLGELTKWVFEQDDPRLVERLVQDPKQQQADQAQQQAEENLLMDSGYPARVHPTDDDKTHVATIAQWMERKKMAGEAIKPETAAHLLQHGMGHAQAIKEKKDKEGIQLMKQLQPYVKVLETIVQQAQSGQKAGIVNEDGSPAPVGAPQPPMAAAPPPAAPQGEPQVKQSDSINYKDAPPSIRRQMEAKYGFVPATDAETQVEHMANVKAAMPAPPKAAPVVKKPAPQLAPV